MSGTTKTFETTFAITGNSFEGAYAFYDSGLIHLYYSTPGQIRKVILNPDGTVNVATAIYTAAGPSVTGDQDNLSKLFYNQSGLINYFNYNGTSSVGQNKSTLSSDK